MNLDIWRTSDDNDLLFVPGRSSSVDVTQCLLPRVPVVQSDRGQPRPRFRNTRHSAQNGYELRRENFWRGDSQRFSPSEAETMPSNKQCLRKQDVFEMICQKKARQLTATVVSTWLRVYFWAFWAPIFVHSPELERFWFDNATCIAGEATIAFLENTEFPAQYPLDENPDATVDIFLLELLAEQWITLMTTMNGWRFEREDDVEGLHRLISRIPYLKNGTATRVTRLFKPMFEDEESGYAHGYRMDVVHAFGFTSTNPVLTFSYCRQHASHLQPWYLNIILPHPEPDVDTYDHQYLDMLQPYVEHILHNRPRLLDHQLRMDVGVRFSRGCLSWYDRLLHQNMPYLLEVEMEEDTLTQRRI
ncbi:hypothetical protein SISSUDRAFT_1037352 [Sistotremastrum suecicum HHB10207 ss-3]|uniref:Uncharacterized protein n=1 Tax=Sistotremastrum suecicum HHB10207 ss-3 TaxID=1314776 RepID=A0A165Y9G0_9AGAM|nr:hypothetical protein SISSUDRAFT_1037352 [Sistotremastrum suecicum HHB10207 ss-3]